MNAWDIDVLTRDVNDFWFGAPGSDGFGVAQEKWFTKDLALDAEIKQRFEGAIEAGGHGRLDVMAETPLGALALVVLLDQFSRNVYRDTARMFENDAHALTIAEAAIGRGFDLAVKPVMRPFFYLPYEHSEDLAHQEVALEKFAALGGEPLVWAQKHADIIKRFGRFPHRNAALGRASTAEETAFLEEPGSSF
ncbi:DUF924 family protein [Pseudomonadota bacterium]